jgi:hypothetical protein
LEQDIRNAQDNARRPPSSEEAEAAMEVLRQYAARSPDEVDARDE